MDHFIEGQSPFSAVLLIENCLTDHPVLLYACNLASPSISAMKYLFHLIRSDAGEAATVVEFLESEAEIVLRAWLIAGFVDDIDGAA